MKLVMALLPLLLVNLFAQAQSNQVVVLWPEGAPGARGTNDYDIPTLTVYLAPADKATGAAMVICPGGAYHSLADHEGKDYALWMNANGVSAFVLKYRLGSHGYRHPVMLNDVSRAMRLVRARAGEWNLDPKRIGIIGSSAGGHLASTMLTHFDAGNPESADPIERQSSRPDLGVLCYPVITMGEKTHAGSRKFLLGDNPSPELIKELSNELHVTKDTPPCFLYHSVEDTVVPVENSLMFAEALRHAGVPFDLHIYQTGSHGSGLGHKVYSTFDPATLHPWTYDCIYWLKVNGFVK